MILTLKANEKRNLANVLVDTKSTLAPSMGVASELIIDFTTGGLVTGEELKIGIPGQSFIGDNGEILDDKGAPVPVEDEIEKWFLLNNKFINPKKLKIEKRKLHVKRIRSVLIRFKTPADR